MEDCPATPRTKQSLKNMVCKEIETPEKLEDAEKRNILCFLLNLDKRNLLFLITYLDNTYSNYNYTKKHYLQYNTYITLVTIQYLD